MKFVALLCLAVMSCNCATIAEPTVQMEPDTIGAHEPNRPAPEGFVLPPEIEDPANDVRVSGPLSVAELYFQGRVEGRSVNRFLKQLAKAEKKGARFAYLEINSSGGEVEAGFQMAKAIENTHLAVICVVDGSAESMGHYILQSCDTRIMTRRSYLMVHAASASGEWHGTADDWENMADDLRATSRGMLEHESRRMTITPAELQKKIPGSRQWHLNWEEALAVCAVDGVAASARNVLSAMRHGAPLPMVQRMDLPHCPN